MLTWKPQYDTKVVKIDNQHKKLIELLNRINSNTAIKMSSEELFKIDLELMDYTNIILQQKKK